MSSVEGASPTSRATRSQYSGSEVYWSHATTLHRVMSASRGIRMSAGEKPVLFICITALSFVFGPGPPNQIPGAP